MEKCEMAAFVASAMMMLKQRLDRVPGDTSRDEYWKARIDQAVAKLERMGVKLTDSADDLMLVADYAAWLHANRDKTGGQPEWLRSMIAGRWLNNGA